MTTSNSTNFSINRNQLIEGAYRLAGVIAEGETPSTEQYSVGSEALNMMVKAWEADGMPLWAIKQYSVTLTASTSTYTIGEGQTVNTPKPLKVIQGYLHNTSSSIDTPMRILTRQEYNMLGNKTSTGNPVQLFYEPLVDTGVLYLFPVPDSTVASAYTVTIVYQRPFEDFDTSSDTPDFPQEWYEAVKYGLAVRLAGENTISLEMRNQLRVEAKEVKDAALGFGTEEGSIYFGVEQRNW